MDEIEEFIERMDLLQEEVNRIEEASEITQQEMQEVIAEFRIFKDEMTEMFRTLTKNIDDRATAAEKKISRSVPYQSKPIAQESSIMYESAMWGNAYNEDENYKKRLKNIYEKNKGELKP